MAVERAETYPVEAPTFFTTVRSALDQLGWKTRSADPTTLMVQATTGISAATWGERITVQVTATGPTTSSLHTSVALKMGLVDWGKRQRRMTELDDAIRRTLATTAPTQLPPAGWHPDRYGAAAQRWWDGSQWTDHTT